MTPKIDSLGAAIVKGACNPEAKGFAVDLAQFELSEIFDDGVLTEVPGIKIVIACHKTWRDIRDQLFLRKVASFLAACPHFTTEEKEGFLQVHLNDTDKAKKLGESLVLILDRLDDMESHKCLPKFSLHSCEAKLILRFFVV